MCNISSGTQLRMSTCLSMKVRIMVYSFLIMSWRRSKNTFYSATTFWLFKAWSKIFWSFYLDTQSDDPGLVFSDCKLKFWKYTWNHYNRTRVFGIRSKVYNILYIWVSQSMSWVILDDTELMFEFGFNGLSM